MTERTWIVNGREVTLAQFRAEHAERIAAVKPVADAWRRGDIIACGEAQAQVRK
jgi:hypothetical protein